jgi:hypothetical protein
MAYVERTPFTGTLTLDLTPKKDLIFDLPPGVGRQLKGEKPGFPEVHGELNKSLPVHAPTLGLAAEMLTRINTTTTNIEDLRAALADVEKLVEVLNESVALHENDREADLATVVDAVRKTSRRLGGAIEAAFEKTINYHSQIAAKAAATRKKNAAAAQAEEDAQEKPEGT